MTRKTSGLQALVDRKVAFRGALLAWYRASRRRLPWRETPSVYGTVVSEFMLQQTQVSTVLPYFERWMAAVPDFGALARASEGTVLKLWEGLGYYSRARNLHRLAKELSKGPIPGSSEDWQKLPGVGPYTAAAIASIAFGEPRACVDGNVVRILSRLTGDPTPYRDSGSASKAFAPLAQELVNPEAPGDHNQAMMELGATLCFRRNPTCLVCPVRDFCVAARAENPEDYPKLEAKQIERRSVVRVWSEISGALLLHCNPSGSRRLANLHELPTAEQVGLEPDAAQRGALVARHVRGITRFRITESIHQAAPPKGRLPEGLIWVPLGQLESISLSGPHRKWISRVLASRGLKGAQRPLRA